MVSSAGAGVAGATYSLDCAYTLAKLVDLEHLQVARHRAKNPPVKGQSTRVGILGPLRESVAEGDRVLAGYTVARTDIGIELGADHQAVGRTCDGLLELDQRVLIRWVGARRHRGIGGVRCVRRGRRRRGGRGLERHASRELVLVEVLARQVERRVEPDVFGSAKDMQHAHDRAVSDRDWQHPNVATLSHWHGGLCAAAAAAAVLSLAYCGTCSWSCRLACRMGSW